MRSAGFARSCTSAPRMKSAHDDPTFSGCFAVLSVMLCAGEALCVKACGLPAGQEREKAFLPTSTFSVKRTVTPDEPDNTPTTFGGAFFLPSTTDPSQVAEDGTAVAKPTHSSAMSARILAV